MPVANCKACQLGACLAASQGLSVDLASTKEMRRTHFHFYIFFFFTLLYKVKSYITNTHLFGITVFQWTLEKVTC